MLQHADFTQRHIHRFSNQPAVEQQMVREFFAGKPGFYVDVGANDPVLDSQSQHLEAIGWTGLLVEPDPDCCALLRQPYQLFHSPISVPISACQNIWWS